MSCRDKERIIDSAPLQPPLGIAFSAPNGEVSFFDLTSLAIIHWDRFVGWTVLASAVSQNSQWLTVAESGTQLLGVYKLPELEISSIGYIGGVPLDVEFDPSGLSVYAITNNGIFWRYNIGDYTFDTLDIDLNPRHFALRPPTYQEAWIVYEGSQTVDIVNLIRFAQTDSLSLPLPPTDIQFSRDGQTCFLTLAQDSGSIVMLDPTTQAILRSHPCSAGSIELGISDCGTYAAVGDTVRGNLHIWNTVADSSWDIYLGEQPVRVRFQQGATTIFALSFPESRLVRIEFADGTPQIVKSAIFPVLTRDFVLWGTPQ